MSISTLSNREVCLLLCVNARINYVRGWIRHTRHTRWEGEKRFPPRHMEFNNNSICCYLSLGRHSLKVFVFICILFSFLLLMTRWWYWWRLLPHTRLIYANIMCVHYVVTPSQWVFSRYCLRFTLYSPLQIDCANNDILSGEADLLIAG